MNIQNIYFFYFNMIDHKPQYAIQFVIDLYDGVSSATLTN